MRLAAILASGPFDGRHGEAHRASATTIAAAAELTASLAKKILSPRRASYWLVSASAQRPDADGPRFSLVLCHGDPHEELTAAIGHRAAPPPTQRCQAE